MTEPDCWRTHEVTHVIYILHPCSVISCAKSEKKKNVKVYCEDSINFKSSILLQEVFDVKINQVTPPYLQE